MDEPTSSLDKETEKELMSSVLKDTNDKIIFIISHNSSIMNYCDHVVEIKDERAVLVK
ncbi:MAG: hypothetical protein PT956_05770 [Firmicutes bacterium]|nr:hypothetical protein [Bacillota bacterium]